MVQGLRYNIKNGHKEEIDKLTFLKELSKVTQNNLLTLEKLTYEEIIKQCKIKMQEKGIYTCKTSDEQVIICLIDKTYGDFDKWCKKNNLPVETNSIILYHGSKEGIKGKIQPISRPDCDFGKGFYIGNNKWQVEQLACFGNNPTGYKVSYNEGGLKVYRFKEDYDWALFIALNRNISALNKYRNIINYLSEKFINYDLLIGTIADDVFSTSLTNFFNNFITFETLCECLDIYKYGTQWCFTTQKACDSIKILDTWNLSSSQIEQYRKERMEKVRKVGEETNTIINKNVGKKGTYFKNIIEDGLWKRNI